MPSDRIAILELYRGGWHGGTAAYLSTLLPVVPEPFQAVYAAPPGDPGIERLTTAGAVGKPVADRDLTQFCREAHVRLVHTHGVRAGRIGRYVAHRLKLPQVATYHSRFDQDYRSPWRRMVASFVDAANLREARLLIAVSPAVKEDLVRRGASWDRVVVVESGIGPPPPAAAKRALRRALGVPEDGWVVGTLARHQSVKGLDLLVRALAKLPDVTACLVGVGTETGHLRALAEEEGVAQRVRFPGYRPEGRALLPAFDVLAVPSRSEGFGLAALEAMAQGVPVVAFAVGHLPILLEGDAGIVVRPEDPEALAEGLRRVLADEALRARLIQCGQKRYQERYTAEAMAARTVRVFQQALE